MQFKRNSASISTILTTFVFAALMTVPAALTIATIPPTPRAEAKVETPSEAFMSLPFGHNFKRTKARMEGVGATTLSQANLFLSMKGDFEGRPAVYMFTFQKNKGLKGKSLAIQSTGKASEDEAFYKILRLAYTRQFGNVPERPLPNTWVKGRLMYRNTWTPDRYTSITLTYNPEATNRFPGNTNATSERPIQLVYAYSKWD